jgi:hypothetical protein
MSKPISPSKLRKNLLSLPAEKRRESIERAFRVYPQWIMEETARTDGHYDPKVVKNLEKMYDVYKTLWVEFLVANHA